MHPSYLLHYRKCTFILIWIFHYNINDRLNIFGLSNEQPIKLHFPTLRWEVLCLEGKRPGLYWEIVGTLEYEMSIKKSTAKRSWAVQKTQLYGQG